MDERQLKGLAKIVKLMKRAQAQDPRDYVYVVKCADFYKIGITHHLDSRLNTLRCGNPFEVELIYAERCENAKEVEAKLHKTFEDLRERREWFRLTEKELCEVKQQVKQKAE